LLIDRISSDTGLPAEYIVRVALTASHRYKSYDIPKRGGGQRRIDHPARELKLLQEWLAQNVFSRLPVHSSAHAYKKGSTILRNAEIHSVHNFLLRVDFMEFFPSLTGGDVVSVLRENAAHLGDRLLTDEDYDFVRKLVCRKNRLTIGAPTSPLVSNVIMFDFDSEWVTRCNDMGVAYTRYADDLYFSTNSPGILASLLERLRNDLAERPRPRLRINERKTVFASKKRRRLVTGLVLTPDRRISLGRDRKRRIKGLVFRFGKGTLSRDEVKFVRGFIAFARSVEPGFVESLQKKYGKEIMDSIAQSE
jgi:hypothetical protein